MCLNLKSAAQSITKEINSKYGSKIEDRRNHHYNVAFNMGFNSTQEAMKYMGRVEFLKIANINAPSINN